MELKRRSLFLAFASSSLLIASNGIETFVEDFTELDPHKLLIASNGIETINILNRVVREVRLLIASNGIETSET